MKSDILQQDLLCISVPQSIVKDFLLGMWPTVFNGYAVFIALIQAGMLILCQQTSFIPNPCGRCRHMSQWPGLQGFGHCTVSGMQHPQVGQTLGSFEPRCTLLQGWGTSVPGDHEMAGLLFVGPGWMHPSVPGSRMWRKLVSESYTGSRLQQQALIRTCQSPRAVFPGVNPLKNTCPAAPWG